MTRTLALVAIVSFVLAVGCFAASFAIVGGPFSIDDAWRFHRQAWPDVGRARPAARAGSPATPGP